MSQKSKSLSLEHGIFNAIRADKYMIKITGMIDTYQVFDFAIQAVHNCTYLYNSYLHLGSSIHFDLLLTTSISITVCSPIKSFIHTS